MKRRTQQSVERGLTLLEILVAVTLIGVIFSIDTVLENAVEGVGEGQYAVSAVDPRYGEQPVASVATAARRKFEP